MHDAPIWIHQIQVDVIEGDGIEQSQQPVFLVLLTVVGHLKPKPVGTAGVAILKFFGVTGQKIGSLLYLR